MLSRFAAKLPSRGLVQLSGPDALKFLQSLVTNDVPALTHPQATPVSPSAFLNGRGRLLFGTLMFHTSPDRFLLDLPAPRIPALIKHLTQYRLRANVDISDITPEHTVWVIVGATTDDAVHAQLTHDATLFQDPRLPALGQRALLPPDFPGFHNLPLADETHFTRLRISQGVPDDTDFDGTPLPLDLALHLLNGVSFNKGCYLGQELTARSHFTGVLRKRITPIAVVPDDARVDHAREDDFVTGLVDSHETLRLDKGSQVMIPGKTKAGGMVTSCVDNVGLAVLRLSDTFKGMQTGQLLLEDGRRVLAWRPGWWGADAKAVTSGQ